MPSATPLNLPSDQLWGIYHGVVSQQDLQAFDLRRIRWWAETMRIEFELQKLDLNHVALEWAIPTDIQLGAELS